MATYNIQWITRVVLLTVLTGFSESHVLSQSRSVKPSVPTTSKTGPLKSEDVSYYAILRRGNSFEPGQNTLKGVPANAYAVRMGGYTNLVVVDVRTMKELSWWPEGNTFLVDNAVYVITPAVSWAEIRKFSPTGSLLYNKELRIDFNGQPQAVVLSKDLTHVYFFSNGDVWVGDFNLSTGTISGIHQVTHAGVIPSAAIDSYMVNQTIVAGGYLINALTGSFVKCGMGGYVPMSTKASRYLVALPRPHKDEEIDEIWDLEARKPIFSTTKGSIRLWLNASQTRLLYDKYGDERKRIPNQTMVVDLAANPVRQYAVPWKIVPYSKPDQRNTVWTSIRDRLSPNGISFFQAGVNEKSEGGLYIHNSETLNELVIPINLKGNMWRGANYPPEARWTDDTHLIFAAPDGSLINNEEITTATQGTYIVDLNTKKARRVTPYLIDFYKDKVLRFPGTDLILFQANNYLFSCSPGGESLNVLTKKPGQYTLESSFLDTEAK